MSRLEEYAEAMFLQALDAEKDFKFFTAQYILQLALEALERI